MKMGKMKRAQRTDEVNTKSTGVVGQRKLHGINIESGKFGDATWHDAFGETLKF